jgi:hypothetical protein
MTQSLNLHIVGDISMLRFHITQEIFKLSMIHSFDLMKLMNFETTVTTFVYFWTFCIQGFLVYQAMT